MNQHDPELRTPAHDDGDDSHAAPDEARGEASRPDPQRAQPGRTGERPPLVDAARAGRIGREKPGQEDSRTVHDGRIVHLSVDTARFPDDSTGDLELIRHSGAAAVVPILGDPEDPDPEILLIRQFRYAAGGDIYEIPAGRPDREGEPWEDVAHRELEEETGYTATRMRPLTTIYTTPGFTDERIHIFLATGLEKGQSNLDHDEFVEVVPMTVSRAMDAVEDGTIIDAKSVCGLLFYGSLVR